MGSLSPEGCCLCKQSLPRGWESSGAPQIPATSLPEELAGSSSPLGGESAAQGHLHKLKSLEVSCGRAAIQEICRIQPENPC